MFVAFENSVWQIRFFLKKIWRNFFFLQKIFFEKIFFLKNFFFEIFFWKKNFFEDIFFNKKKIFWIFFKFCFEIFFWKKISKFFFEKFYWKFFFLRFFFFFFFFWICSWCFKCLAWFWFWMSIQLFHLFHNAHSISALSFKISFHFEFQVSFKCHIFFSVLHMWHFFVWLECPTSFVAQTSCHYQMAGSTGSWETQRSCQVHRWGGH